MRYFNCLMIWLVVVLVWPQMTAQAFINPNFTPINLVEQSQLIYVLEFAPADEDGFARAKVLDVIKGDEVETVEVDLLAGAFEAQGRLVMDLLADGKTQAMLFAGAYANQEQEMGEMLRQGYLHLAGKWLVVSMWEEDLWEMEKIDSLMLGTWAGSTDMLQKAVAYVTSDPYASIPVNCGVSWAEPMRIGEIAGDVAAARAVDVDQSGREALYIAAKSGDRIYRWGDDGFTDVTAVLGLSAKSAASTWGDIDGNGTLDLVSYDGEALAVYYQVAEGGFEKRPYDVGDALADGCVSLSVFDGGIIASGGGVPVILTMKEDGAVETKKLSTGDVSAKVIKPGVACLVADMDNDGRVDILQPADGGSLFYRGVGGGDFALPIWGPVGDGNGSACLGDYDGDGLLDILTVGEAANQIWHNFGGGQFSPTLDVSGEISYIAKPGGVVCQTGDINNDGRQDVLIGYGAGLSPQLFFNRGFRSFGHARMIDIAEQKILPEAGIGQQATCLGDFNGDGAMDMTLVLADGSAWVLLRETEGDSALAARAYVGLDSQMIGPVNVWAVKDGWSLGAWSVQAGEPGAFFGAMEPGPLEIFWRTGDGQVKTMELIVEDGPIRVDIGGE